MAEEDDKEEEIEQEIERLKLIEKSLTFNHNFDDGSSYNVIINPEYEVDKYKLGITQLTLPQRFGMYKTIKNEKKTTEIELEDPIFDSTSSSLTSENPEHKIRNIFD